MALEITPPWHHHVAILAICLVSLILFRFNETHAFLVRPYKPSIVHPPASPISGLSKYALHASSKAEEVGWDKTSNKKKKRSRSISGKRLRKQPRKSWQQPPRDPLSTETWRVFGVELHPDEYCTENTNFGLTNEVESGKFKEFSLASKKAKADKLWLTQPVVAALMERLGIAAPKQAQAWGPDNLPPQILDLRVVRRSLDARKKKRRGPRYVFVLDVDMKASLAETLRLKPQPGRLELLSTTGTPTTNINSICQLNSQKSMQTKTNDSTKKRVIIVGAGPAGLFAALTLARSRQVTPIVLERGLPVESRGKSIGALISRRCMNSESNFAFGEGGAGTWSDGKLTTRIGRNSDTVRYVLETLVEYGAPENILVHGSPHLGTDNLVKLLRAMRLDLRRLGGEVIFGAKADIVIEDGITKGVRITKTRAVERNVHLDGDSSSLLNQDGKGEITIMGDAVIMATGHSARDVYEKLHEAGVQLEAKGFAVGFRVEHPQKIINKIQYGNEWGLAVRTKRQSTDSVNERYFASLHDNSFQNHEKHKGRLPVPSYRLATDSAHDGHRNRGVYSFCMCPGGQIVPASTDPDEVCVNGMSFSRRDSTFANSALVVTVASDDEILQDYKAQHGVLAGVAFQRDMERRASKLGGGNLTVPVQRLPDFIVGKASSSAPPSSYRLGVKPAACHEIYPDALVTALRDAVCNHFETQMPGFVDPDALLHGVETRTSSPVRVSRDAHSLEAIGTKKLFPAGEGAGFAGGIVSAAVDGISVANAVLESFSGDTSLEKTSGRKMKSVGFDY